MIPRSDTSTDRLLNRVKALVERGERITESDAAALFNVADATALARIARVPRERRWGLAAHYCDAARITVADQTDDELVAAVLAAGSAYLRIARGEDVSRAEALASALAKRGVVVPIHVLPSAVDASVSARPLDDSLASLSRVADVLVAADLDGLAFDRWRAVHQCAHAHGIRSMAAMPYFNADCADACASHLETLRTIQDETGLFTHFVPIPIVDREQAASHRAFPTALQTLRTVAVARIVLDNIAHISVSPSMVGLEVATLALSHGADTIDTVTGGMSRPGVVHGLGGDAAAASLPVLDAEKFEAASGGSELVSRIAEARFRPVAVAADLQSGSVTSALQHL